MKTPIRIIKRALELGLTQGELAARARLSRQAIVKLLSGETHDPQISTVDSLARALNVSPLFLRRLLIRRSVIDRPIQQASREIDDHSAFIADVTVPNGTTDFFPALHGLDCTVEVVAL